MKGNGRMVNNMGVASLLILKAILEQACGLMERGQDGLMSKSLLIFETRLIY